MDAFWTWLSGIADRLMFWRVIQPDEGGVRTTCGRWPKVLKAGIHWVAPIIGEMRVIPVKEQVLDIRTQSLRTKDGVSVVVGVTVAYEVLDTYRAAYEVQDWDQSLSNEILSVVGREIRSRTIDQCVGEELSTAICKELRKVATANWGLKIIRVGVSDFDKCRSLRIMGIGKEST